MATVKSGRLICAAILAILVYGMIASMLGTLVGGLTKDSSAVVKHFGFSLTPGQGGSVMFAQAVGLIIASILVGPLVDNKGKKTGLVIGFALIAAALFLIPNASGYNQLTAFVFLLGLGGAIIVTAASALVSDINPEKRSSTLNLLNLFFGLGGLLTPLITGRLLSGNAVTLCYMVAVLTVVTLLVHATTAMPGPTGERGFKLSEIGVVTGNPALYLLALFMFLYVACEVGVWNWLSTHLISQGVPEADALTILSLGFGLGMLIGRVVVSRILLKVPAATVTLWASVLMAITTYLALQSSDTTIAWVAVFCAGVAMAPVFPTLLGMTGDAFPKATATAMGLVITCGWVGLAVSSKIIGAIGGGDVKMLKTALLVLPAASILMIIVNLILRPVLARAKAAA